MKRTHCDICDSVFVSEWKPSETVLDGGYTVIPGHGKATQKHIELAPLIFGADICRECGIAFSQIEIKNELVNRVLEIKQRAEVET